MKYLSHETYTLFEGFKKQSRELVVEHFKEKPTIVFQLIQYCKSNNVVLEGNSDTKCWYEDLSGFDSIFCLSQNEEFVIVKTDDNSYIVFRVNNVNDCERMEPSYAYFKHQLHLEIEAEKRWYDNFFKESSFDEFPKYTHIPYLSFSNNSFLLKAGKSEFEEIKVINELDFITTNLYLQNVDKIISKDFTINSATFICLLPQNIQNEIASKVVAHLKSEGHSEEEINEAVENVLCERLWVVEDIMDISIYFSKN